VEAFTDADPVEKHMGLRVEEMTPQQLVNYVVTYQKAMNDLELTIQGHPERAIFKAMQRDYTPEVAGRIVKWVFYKYMGRRGDRFVGCSDFVKGARWWHDKIRAEMSVKDTILSEAEAVNARFATEL
jgi:glutathione peroxidase-family protein